MVATPSAIDSTDPVARGSRLSVSPPRKAVGFESALRARRSGGADIATSGLAGREFRRAVYSTTPRMTAAAAANIAIRGQIRFERRRIGKAVFAIAVEVNSANKS